MGSGATAGGDARGAHSAAHRRSEQLCGGGANTDATDCPWGRTRCTNYHRGSNCACPVNFVLSEDPGKSTGHFSYLFARAYERDQRLENLSPIDRVKTLFLTQSSLPLLQLWGGRLHLDGFTNRLHMQNVQIGPSAIGGLQNLCPPQRGYPGGPRSARFYGLSLSFHLGREAEIRRPTKAWRCFPRTVGAPR